MGADQRFRSGVGAVLLGLALFLWPLLRPQDYGVPALAGIVRSEVANFHRETGYYPTRAQLVKRCAADLDESGAGSISLDEGAFVIRQAGVAVRFEYRYVSEDIPPEIRWTRERAMFSTWLIYGVGIIFGLSGCYLICTSRARAR